MQEIPLDPPPPGRHRPLPPPRREPPTSGGGGGGGILRRVFTGIASTILIGSLLLNVYFLIVFASMTQGVYETNYEDGDLLERIVILPIIGVIDDDMSSFVGEALRALSKDPPAAVILRVDSPGGGVGASDRIAQRIEDFKRETGVPVVASFGTIAASGGYYISAGADEIVAEPMTITGSIGVIAQAFTVGELLTKLGIEPETIVATGATKKDTLDWTRSWTEADRDMLRKFLDHSHERFIQVVYQGRQDHLTPELVREAATGEPLTARQALDVKLIDQEGYLEDAIDAAKTRAGMALTARPRVTIITRPQGLFASLMEVSARPSRAANLSDSQWVRRVIADLSQPQLEYRFRW